MHRIITKRTMTVFMSAILLFYVLIPTASFVGSTVYADGADEAVLRNFDFGTSTSPVMDGFTKVDSGTLYTAEMGYGLDQAIASRLRDGGTDMTNDFVVGSSYTFMVDLPNGDYDITVYSGDLLAGTATSKLNVMLEGVQAGVVQAKQSVSESTFRSTVTDGQLTVGLSGVSGGNAYLNGLVIQKVIPIVPIPEAPSDLFVSGITEAGVNLQWTASENATSYNVYRSETQDGQFEQIANDVIITSYTDMVDTSVPHYYQVKALNEAGQSEGSNMAASSAFVVSKTLKFDFGLAGSPVLEGYKEVNLSTLYTPNLGYGIVDPTGMYGRDRGQGTEPLRDMLRDWIAGSNWQFKVDVPNGLYSVKLYVGDFLGSIKTNVNIEGTDSGTIGPGRNAVTNTTISQVFVMDGQMNFIVGGANGVMNGIEITPILMAPSDLKLDEKVTDPESPSVTLSWKGTSDAAKYNVYRKASEDAIFHLLGSTSTTSYLDNTVDVGITYEYQLTAVNESFMETKPTASISVSMQDSNVPIPHAPANPTVGVVNKNDLTFSWDPSEGAKTYNIYRTDKENGTFKLIGKTRETSYTDITVLTTIPYYYKVAAVSAGGVSEQSETVTTPAVTVLYRQAEFLDRALVAVKIDEGIYVGWKMLGTDPSNIAFNLYRDATKVNDKPITGATNLLDKNGKEASVYVLKTIGSDGKEKVDSKSASVWNKNYLSVPLQKPADGVTPSGEAYTYSANDTSVGDLDGDGTYELIVKWDGSSRDNSQSGYTSNVYLDAYKLDGTRLWRIDLGKNIRAGAHYTQFMVYDLDGDGKAEVTLKTADGTVDGTGQVIGDASADYRNTGGYILNGPEYLTMFDGMTGKAVTTTNYDPPRGVVTDWGDGYGNRVDRFLAAVAYLDGEHPSLIFSRGYYTRTVIVAYDYKNGQLVERWKFDTKDDQYGVAFEAQGDHNLSVGDVDGDGKDEITFGAMAIDDSGTPLYNTGLGHGDAGHLGDLDPTHPGLEFFNVHEHSNSPYGMDFRDAATGEVLWGVFTGIDTGRGMAADIDPNYPGEEVWAATITNAEHIPLTGLYSAQGERISMSIPSSTNFGIWWDGDLSRELLDNNHIDKWDYVNHTTNRLLTADGSLSNNGTKATPKLQADLFGDWREEAVWRSADSTELRIYTTTDLNDVRLRTLMHDPIYRLGIAWQNVGYNQPPHTSFFLGTGMEEPPAPKIQIAGTHSLPLAEGAPGKPVLSDNNVYDTGLKDGDYSVTMNMWWGNNGTKFNLYENGNLVNSVNMNDASPAAQSVKTDFSGKKNGTYVYTCELVNSLGTTKCDPLTVTVTDASPGQAVISHDNWDKDGSYKVTMNLWWGTNATKYELYENGTLVESQPLAALTPGSQSAITVISGKSPGTYTYQAKLINNAGETVSNSITVVVQK